MKQSPRVRIELSFEVERDKLPTTADIEAAFRGAIDAILKGDECYYKGRMGVKFVRVVK